MPCPTRATAKIRYRWAAIPHRLSSSGKAGIATGCDYVSLHGAYLIGCHVSELARLSWHDVEAIEGGGQVHLLGKSSKPRTVRISADTLTLLETLGRSANDACFIPLECTSSHLGSASGAKKR
jgi:integrase